MTLFYRYFFVCLRYQGQGVGGIAALPHSPSQPADGRLSSAYKELTEEEELSHFRCFCK